LEAKLTINIINGINFLIQFCY